MNYINKIFIVAICFCIMPVVRLYSQEGYTAVSSSPSGSDTIIIGGDIDFYPYSFKDEDGEPRGLSVELARAIAKEGGFKIDIRLMPWYKSQQMLATGSVDILFNMANFESRLSKYAYSNSYVAGSIYVYRNIKADIPYSLCDLDGKNVVMVRGDYSFTFLQRSNSTAVITSVENYFEEFTALNRGDGIEYTIVDENTAKYFIKKYNFNNIRRTNLKLFNMNYCFVACRYNGSFVKSIDSAMSKLMLNGTYDRIYDKWVGEYFGNSSTEQNIIRSSYYWLLTLFIIMTILLSLIMRRTLRMLKSSEADEKFTKKRSEEQLSKFTGLLNINSALHFVVNKHYRIIHIYSADTYEINLKYYTGRTITELFDGELLEVLMKDIRSVLRTRQNITFCYDISRFHHDFTCEFNIMYSDSHEIDIVIYDITNFRDSELNLEQQINSLQGQNDLLIKLNASLFDSNNGGKQDDGDKAFLDLLHSDLDCMTLQISFKLDGRVFNFSDNIEKMTGYPATDFNSGKLIWNDILIKEDYEQFRKILDMAIIKTEAYSFVYRIYRKDGEIRWLYQRGKFFPGHDDVVWVNRAIVLDVSECMVQNIINIKNNLNTNKLM